MGWDTHVEVLGQLSGVSFPHVDLGTDQVLRPGGKQLHS